MEKRTPAFAPLIQKLLNRVYGETIMQCREVVEPEVFAPLFTSGPPIPEHAKGKGQQGDAGPSSSYAPPPKRSNRSAISKFLQAMFSTCRDACAYKHEARELAKEGHRIQNADRRAAGLTIEADSTSLAPSLFVDITMPPITDDDFYFGDTTTSGYDDHDEYEADDDDT